MKLNIKLLKQNYNIAQSLKDSHNLTTSRWNHDENITLYTEDKFSGQSSWKSFINEGVKNPVFSLSSSISSALMFVPIDDKILVVSFGMAHSKLKENCFVKDFGLKVVLNSVEHNTIKSLDLKTHDEITVNKRVQTSKKADISAFGVDTERDMLKEITGTPIDVSFAKELTGKHALTISCDITPSEIASKCKEIYDAYTNRRYETHFKWIDNIRVIEDKDLINTLNNKLFVDLDDCVTNDNAIDLHLSPPDIINYSSFGTIIYKGFRSKKEFDILDVDNYISELKRFSVNLKNIQSIKNHRVAEKEDTSVVDKWKIYDCFVYETEHDTKKYVLSDGQWYSIDKSLVEEVDNYIDSIPRGISLPDAKKTDNEEKYNVDLESSHSANLICFDKKLIKLTGWSSSIEPCDFFSKDLEFIHIKDNASSSKLSHLFNQGIVSAEAYLREKDFRKIFKDKARTINPTISSLLPDARLKLERDKFKIVYAVMRKPYRDGTYGLPFFSKVTLRNSAKRLEDLGYKVSFSWIKKIL
jgi:uncharacterized protein (TIGR04141 family)